VGQIVNALWSPALGANLALGYVRKECNQPGTEVSFENAGQPATATVQALPFRPG
jgi:glycine cleavage system aminomethyltransferase T